MSSHNVRWFPGAAPKRYTKRKKVCCTNLTGMTYFRLYQQQHTSVTIAEGILLLQVVSKPHHTLVTLLLCNAVALEVGHVFNASFAGCSSGIDAM